MPSLPNKLIGAAFAVLGLVTFALANEEPEQPGFSILDLPKLEISEDQKTVTGPGFTVHAGETKYVDIDATVAQVDGALELVACTAGTKEHESIFALQAKAHHVHVALILINAEAGSPFSQRKTENDEWKITPPHGQEIEISVVTQKAGKEVVTPISEFMTLIENEGLTPEESKFPTDRFLFTGSVVKRGHGDDNRTFYLADDSGNAITLSTFGDELLALPGQHSHGNGSLAWRVSDASTLAQGDKVKIRLTPVL